MVPRHLAQRHLAEWNAAVNLSDMLSGTVYETFYWVSPLNHVIVIIAIMLHVILMYVIVLFGILLLVTLHYVNVF